MISYNDRNPKDPDGDGRMMKGLVYGGNPYVTVTDIPAEMTAHGYDVLVYIDPTQNTGWQVIKAEVKTPSTATNPSQTLYLLDDGTDWVDTGFVQADGDADDGTATPAGNYIRFSNLTSSSFQVRLYRTSGSSTAGPSLNGIQIVATDNDLAHVEITAPDASATEGGDTATFRLTRDDSHGPLSVQYVVDGTAGAGDYTPTLTGTATFADGESSVDIVIAAVDDTAGEGDETLRLTLVQTGTYLVGASGQAVVTIVDNEPRVSIAAIDADAGEQGANPATFRVSRDAAGAALTVGYTIGGSASAGDYTPALSGSVVIPNGALYADITVTPIDDAIAEGSETLVLTLAAGSGYSLAVPLSATATIADNEPTLTVSTPDADAAEAGRDPATIRVSRDNTNGNLAVSFTLSGSAAATDYTQDYSAGTVVIPAGSTYVDLTFTPVDDSLKEGNETVRLQLAASSTYTVGTPDEGTITIVDDDWLVNTATWTGEGGDGLASNPLNWFGELGNGVDVYLDGAGATGDADLYWDVTHELHSWTQTADYDGTVTIPTTYATYSGTFTVLHVTGDVILEGGTWTQVDNLYGYSQANRDTHRLRVDVGGDFTLGAGATIDVTSAGYRPGSPSFNGGATHGGIGGAAPNPSTPYDSILQPTLSGEGGGSTNDWQMAGGGAVYLTVAGRSTIDGQILANVTAPYHTYTRAAAGGSIYLSTGQLVGAGGFQANGGDSTGGSNTGDGGGGRIAVILTQAGADFAGFTGSFDVQPGVGGASSAHASGGTVYLQAAGQATGEGQVTVDFNNRNGDLIDDKATPFTSEDLSAAGVVLRDKALVALTANTAIGSLDMAGGTTLLLDGKTLTVNCHISQAVLDGLIYLDSARTVVYDPLVGSPQVVFTGLPPVDVWLTAPADGTIAAMNSAWSLSAGVSGEGVTSVEFFAGSTPVGSDADAPYTANWTPPTAGTVALTAVAHHAGGTTTSEIVQVRVALGGDATLDNSVTGADLAALATNWGAPSGATWQMGDFNGDGAVTGADLAALATHWNQSVAPASAGDAPEQTMEAVASLVTSPAEAPSTPTDPATAQPSSREPKASVNTDSGYGSAYIPPRGPAPRSAQLSPASRPQQRESRPFAHVPLGELGGAVVESPWLIQSADAPVPARPTSSADLDVEDILTLAGALPSL